MSNKADQLAIWNAASTPDLDYTKKAKVNGNEQTSISGYWFFKEATRLFGPCGIGWGYEILEERLDKGAFVKIQVDNVDKLFDTFTHTVKINFWYKLDGVKGEIVQYGHTPAIYRSKYGLSDDSEAPKKSLTDAIKKAMSMLGFASDVFLGMFDDKDYLNAVVAEQSIEKAEDKQSEVDAQHEELTAMISRNIELIKKAVTLNEVNGLEKVNRTLQLKSGIAHLAKLCAQGQRRITEEANARREILKQKAAFNV